ncbi:hypothetical protein DBT53_002630, partial [Aerococcus mictus]|uniref:hypothetical protein n=1 Tax=Aerococcus mictus TaxID=2976810 RepID=UPI002FD16845
MIGKIINSAIQKRGLVMVATLGFFIFGIYQYQQLPIDAETSAVGPANVRKVLTLYGSIKPNGEREQAIRARYPGTVKSVEKRPGDA